MQVEKNSKILYVHKNDIPHERVLFYMSNSHYEKERLPKIFSANEGFKLSHLYKCVFLAK